MAYQCGHSFKNFKRIPVYQIPLCGKMIHYGIRISLSYIYIYICKEYQLKPKVLLELHTSPIGRHSRFLKAYHRVKKEFFWEGLKYDVRRFAEESLVFQQNKVDIVKTSGILQSLNIPC
jgi:hypothetical protein